MGLFKKKFCDVCGEKIGFLGNNKLEDGNMCDDCAEKLSPWFENRRHATVEQIKAQLAYREENAKKLEEFREDLSIGEGTKFKMDVGKKQFLVQKKFDIQAENPDILELSQVKACELKVVEDCDEVTYVDDEGERKSYTPARYKWEYDFRLMIQVEHPFFDTMDFQLNSLPVTMEQTGRIRSFDPMDHSVYRYFLEKGEEIRDVLLGIREPDLGEETQGPASGGPRMAATCPHCGATTVPDIHGRCEFCGGVVG